MKNKAGAAGKVKPFFRAAVRDGGVLEISVYEEIGEDFWSGGGVTAAGVKQQIDQAGAHNSILLRINSPGGDAFEGVAIGNVLRATGKPINGVIDGIAASAASVLAMACDRLEMGTGSMMMIHKAWTMCMGNADDMAKMSDTLSRIDFSLADGYCKKTGKSKDEILEMMKAETWMGAQECVDGGFADALSSDSDSREEAKALAKSFKALVDRKIRSESTGSKTKSVDGEDLTWNDFVIATDHDDINTWHLPWHFSSLEKTKAHLRDAVARFDQVEGISEEEKHTAWTKLVDLCKKYGIHVAEKDAAHVAIRNDDDNADKDGQCDCTCQACMGDDCANCSMEDCDCEDCMDCPAQQETDEDDDIDDKAATTPAAAVEPTPAPGAEVTAASQASVEPAATTEEPSNLSLYEARLALLRRKAS